MSRRRSLEALALGRTVVFSLGRIEEVQMPERRSANVRCPGL